MRDSYSFLRLIVCYVLCAFFLFYSFFTTPTIKHKNKPTFTDIFQNTPQKEENLAENTESLVENINKTPQETTSQKVESVASTTSSKKETITTSAAAVKGKILTRYISPYSVKDSYSGVYLKNYTSAKVDLKELLNKKINFKINKNSEPQVLIMHTHTTESFMQTDENYYTEDFNSRSTNNNKNMVKIGGIITKKLNDNGIKTLHDKTQHDYPEYTGSYNRAAKTINSYLKKYPSIKIVLDLHRDAISADGGKAKLVTEIGGKKAAQVMLVMGSQTGSIKDHPKWEENLSLAVKLQQTMEAKYPTLARPLMLMSKKYNQSLSTGSLLIEFGTDVNTLSEACYSAEMVGDSLVSLLNTLK
ncbi:MAG: stage II sporulation protein P [Clostridia bacterium]|nr:stage II sporulation protein P [Clostridia bacterium]